MGCLKLPVIHFEACASQLRIEAQLSPSKEYYAYLYDKFSAWYKAPAISDADGILFVDLTGFKQGFFNEHAGQFVLRIEELTDPGTFKNMTVTDLDGVETTSKSLIIRPVKVTYTQDNVLASETGNPLQSEGGESYIRVNPEFTPE